MFVRYGFEQKKRFEYSKMVNILPVSNGTEMLKSFIHTDEMKTSYWSKDVPSLITSEPAHYSVILAPTTHACTRKFSFEELKAWSESLLRSVEFTDVMRMHFSACLNSSSKLVDVTPEITHWILNAATSKHSKKELYDRISRSKQHKGVFIDALRKFCAVYYSRSINSAFKKFKNTVEKRGLKRSEFERFYRMMTVDFYNTKMFDRKEVLFRQLIVSNAKQYAKPLEDLKSIREAVIKEESKIK
jgi:hypothetical protein